MHVLSIALIAAQAVSAVPNLSLRASAGSTCSSSDGRYKLSQFDTPVQGNGNANGMSTWKLTVDDTSSGFKQKVTGFGAAVTDSTVSVFNALSADNLNSLLRNLLTSDGANFSLMRHTVASSDLSGDPAYTYDDNNNNADPQLNGFNLGDRGYAMAAMLKKMRGVNSALQIIGSPWSPPGWMKLNRKLWGTTQNNNLDHQYESSYAQYFVKYLKAYQNAGVNVDHITIQNEPLNSRNGMPTMYIFADESGKLIQNSIGPALKNAGLSTKVWAYDHNTDRADYPQTVLDIAGQYVNTVAWHCYASNNNWGVLTDFHNKNPNVAQYMTECYTSQDLGWSQAADFTMGPMQNWAQGVTSWVLGTDTNDGPRLSYPDGPCTNCRGLVVVDTNSKSYSFTVDYYMMAQFSKFMPRGATVLAGTGSYSYQDGTGIQSVATLNPDGSRTVVMENKFGNDVYVSVALKSGKTWSGRVYKNGITTWTLPA